MKAFFKNQIYSFRSSIFSIGLIIIIFLQSFPSRLFSQYIPYTRYDHDVYSFLDEFSLPYNTCVRPLGRSRIYELLKSIEISELNQRQQNELAFYLRDFGKESSGTEPFKKRLDLYYFRDSLFSLTLNPIAGIDLFSNKNGYEYHWWNGAEARASIGRWGAWISLRDNHESSILTDSYFLENKPGASGIKLLEDGKIDYEDIRGGITYAFKKGSIGLVKENFSWGTNYNGSNIISGHAPAFVRIDLHLMPVKWLDFHYFHGWLNSEEIDSARSFYLTNGYGTELRRFYHKKFMAANIFTFYPFPRLGLSFGNSIIYDYDNMHPAFLIPFSFFKALDHNLNFGIKNMNSQMFFDISSKNINNVHLYSSLFIDELAIKRIIDPDEYNFISFKGGVKISNVPANTFACIEYTISNALTFRHDVPTTTYESNRFNLGHYLTDNSKELFLSSGYKPLRNLLLRLSYTWAVKGPDHTELGTLPRASIKPFTPVEWESRSLAFQLSWQPVNDLYLRIGYEYRNVTGNEPSLKKYTPEFFWGKTGTFNAGINFGF